MKSLSYIFTCLLIAFIFPTIIHAQNDKEETEVHQFTILYNVEATPVKSQGHTNTCWDFSTISFLESELLRMNKGEYNLSEMYIVRNLYPIKAEKYIRYHGLTNFGEGGQAHDVLLAIKNFGVVPEEIYPDRSSENEKPDQSELVAVLKASLNAIINNKGRVENHSEEVCNAILDIYLGKIPNHFEYNSKQYTPKSFAKELNFNLDDYVEITSYQRYPFYEKSVLEIPDNWTNNEYYNVPIDDMMRIIDNAIKNGFSIEWDGDTSEKTFYRKKGYAVIPVEEEENKEDDEELTPEVEKAITQEMREETFDRFQTTDDHLMHITGIAEDQAGTKFYYTKNSWGTKYKYDGYWYMSEAFVRLKTIAIMVHKDAIPNDLKSKLGIY